MKREGAVWMKSRLFVGSEMGRGGRNEVWLWRGGRRIGERRGGAREGEGEQWNEGHGKVWNGKEEIRGDERVREREGTGRRRRWV